jgi:hypothetical protein
MPRKVRVALGVCVLALVLVPASLGGKPSSGSSGGTSGCSITPNQVGLDQVWTVSASGLPTRSSVNLIITFPDGSQSIGAITVASNGTYTASGNSNMSATWGFIAPEQSGMYTYQFVNQIKWPAGTFTKQYASCGVQVS